MSDLVIRSSVNPTTLSLLSATGILHDIGRFFAADQDATGHQGIDGARWLRAHKFPEMICSLVAWCSTSYHEAVERDLVNELGEFSLTEAPDYAHALLWQADFAVDHRGEFVSLDERLSSIRAQHGADSAQVRALDASLTDMSIAFAIDAPGEPEPDF